eukprot:1249706-Pyramimonas_sp.AAC.1
MANGEREYTRSGHQWRTGRENIPERREPLRAIAPGVLVIRTLFYRSFRIQTEALNVHAVALSIHPKARNVHRVALSIHTLRASLQGERMRSLKT